MDLGSLISWLTTNGPELLEGLFAFLGLASVVARFTPTEADDKFVAAVASLVHKLGLTKPAPPAPPAE